MNHYYQLTDTLLPIDALIEERGLAYGDGFFSTLGVKDGQILWANWHKQRFEQGAKQFALKPNISQLMYHLTHLAQQIGQGIIKVIIARHHQAVRGYGFLDKRAKILLKTSASAIYQGVEFVDDFPVQPIAQATTVSAMLGIRPPQFAGLKLISSHEQVFAHQSLLNQQQYRPALTEALVKNVQNMWISGTMSNVFYRLNDTWHTPLVNQSGVNGVARQALLAQYPITERILTDDDLPQLQGLFFCNAVRGIMPMNGLWLDDTLHQLNPAWCAL